MPLRAHALRAAQTPSPPLSPAALATYGPRGMELGPRRDLGTELEAASRGDAAARARFWEVGQAELRRIARAHLARWRGRVSLAPTDVLHEAFVRMVDRSRVTSEGAAFFYTSFATECRRLLVDHYRKKVAERRGGGWQRVSLHSEIIDERRPEFDLIDLSDAVEALAELDPRQASIVDMRLFGDMTVAQCAGALGVSERTVAEDWKHARAWLRVRLDRDSP